jgi:hypothetical protein
MKRPLVLLATWLVAAGLAAGLGFLAVSLVNASPSSPTLRAAATSGDGSGGAATSSPAQPTAPGGVSARQVTAGGTVLATCAGGVPRLAGAPATGWRIDDSAPVDRVEFRNGAQRVEVRADCTSGNPVFAVEGGTASTTTSATTVSAAPSTDNHGGGGHGADDPAGHVSGGHGADG